MVFFSKDYKNYSSFVLKNDQNMHFRVHINMISLLEVPYVNRSEKYFETATAHEISYLGCTQCHKSSRLIDDYN